MNFNITVKTIFSVCLALLITGCVSTRSFYTKLISGEDKSLEQIRFDISGLGPERKACNDSKYLQKLLDSGSEDSKEHHDFLVQLSEYFTSDTLEYYDLTIFYHYGDYNFDYITFKFDSVYVSYELDGDSIPINLFPDTSKTAYANEQISIYPIGISKEYKGDFYIKFNLYIENYKDIPDTTKVPIHLRCEPYKITHVPLLEGE